MRHRVGRRHAIRGAAPLLVLAAIIILASGFLLSRHTFAPGLQPFPDGVEYADAATRLAHGHGYTTTIRDYAISPHAAQAVNPPRYPPGYPLLLAPFAAAGHVNLGTRVAAVLLVLAVGWAALELGGPWAAILAVLLAMLGRFARQSAYLVLSDAFAAALAVAILPLVKRRTPTAIYAAGFLAGYGVVVRDSGLLILACLLLVVTGRDRIRALIGATPPIAGLAIYQWATFGRPWRTGYTYWLPHLTTFAARFVTAHPLLGDGPYGIPDYAHQRLAQWACHLISCHAPTAVGPLGGLPNWFFYPLVIAGFFWIFSLPFITLIGLVAAARWRREQAARFALLLTATTVLLYLAYYYQAVRFMAAPAMMLVVWCAVGIVRMVRGLTSRRSPTAPSSHSPGSVPGVGKSSTARAAVGRDHAV
jgi:hypothetical protein